MGPRQRHSATESPADANAVVASGATIFHQYYRYLPVHRGVAPERIKLAVMHCTSPAAGLGNKSNPEPASLPPDLRREIEDPAVFPAPAGGREVPCDVPFYFKTTRPDRRAGPDGNFSGGTADILLNRAHGLFQNFPSDSAPAGMQQSHHLPRRDRQKNGNAIRREDCQRLIDRLSQQAVGARVFRFDRQ